MTTTIITLALAYALVAAVALLILLQTGVALVFRLGLVLAVAALLVVTYRGIGELRGWPSDTAPPERFRLHWAEVVEPDPMTDNPGSIFLWVTALDENYYLAGDPRAYRLPYDAALAATVSQALGLVADGEVIAGQTGGADPAERSTAEEMAAEMAAEAGGAPGSAVGERVMNLDLGGLVFGTAPAPVTPEKDG